MASLDTNVLVRLVVVDDADQHALAREFVSSHRTVFVPVMALMAMVRVLMHTYRVSPAQRAAIIEKLMDAEDLVLQAPEAIERAVHAYRASAADFSDCVLFVAGQGQQALPVATFDRKLARLPGVQLLNTSRPL